VSLSYPNVGRRKSGVHANLFFFFFFFFLIRRVRWRRDLELLVCHTSTLACRTVQVGEPQHLLLWCSRVVAARCRTRLVHTLTSSFGRYELDAHDIFFL
jgi:hypothetical protein